MKGKGTVQLSIRRNPSTAVLLEADDLTSLSIVTLDGGRSAVADLDGVVTFDEGGYGWINRQWLVREGGFEAGSRRDDFEKMIAFAASRGWVDPMTGAVRAHVEVGAADHDNSQ